MSTAANPSGTDQSLPLPRTFGRYQLFERIGAGGMAEIYLARAKTELGGARLAVVKQILPELSHNEQFANMLIAEAKLAARLNHANVVQVLELGRHDDVLFIAMEYVEGFDLNELIRRCARSKLPLPIEFSLLIVMEALRGLGYAHRWTDEQGNPIEIVHRDVSPSNILISFEGEVKVCDFGIARANDMADLLPEDVIKGKAGYMSPEQARGEQLDARADLFATGIVLWELLSGRKLYRSREGDKPLIEQAREANIPPIPERGLPFEDELHAIVYKALAVDRDERYASAQDMLKDLEAYVGKARLVASPIRFGEWLREHFGENIIAARRARERAAKALEHGPVSSLEPYGTPPPAAAEQEPESQAEDDVVEDQPPSAAPAPSSEQLEQAATAVSQPSQPSRSWLWYVLIGVAIGVALLVVILRSS